MAVGTRAAITMASWPAPLGMRFTANPAASMALGKIRRQPLVHGHGRLVHLVRTLERESAFVCDGLRLSDERFNGSLARCIISMAHVETHSRHARNHVRGVRFDIDFADGGDEAAGLPGQQFDRRDPLGCAGQRVAAQMHGRRAGMIGMA